MNIDEPLALLFIREIAIHCRLAQTAIEAATTAFNKFPVMPWEDTGWEQDEWFRERVARSERRMGAVHAFLVHGALVSKILWPPGPRSKHPVSKEERDRRGSELRLVLGVEDDNPLRHREFRDHLEHFDERLESWYLTPAGQRLDLMDLDGVPFGFSSPEALVSPLRSFGLGHFTFFGEDFEFRPYIVALEDVRFAAERWLGENERRIVVGVNGRHADSDGI